MKQKWWKALPMLLMMAVLGSGSVRTWKNLAVQAADAAALTTDMVETTAQESVPFYHGMINLNTFFQMTLGKNVIEDTAEGDEVVKLKNGYLTTSGCDGECSVTSVAAGNLQGERRRAVLCADTAENQ